MAWVGFDALQPGADRRIRGEVEAAARRVMGVGVERDVGDAHVSTGEESRALELLLHNPQRLLAARQCGRELLGRRLPGAVGVDEQRAAHCDVGFVAVLLEEQPLIRQRALVFVLGRIINPRLARSQLYGGMIWGVSFALHEEAIIDRRTGRIMNADLAEYHIPVNADVPSVEALLIEEHDPYVNGLGVKGVGEIGITGTVGAIANAVWHATGTRVRRFPIRLEDLALAG